MKIQSTLYGIIIFLALGCKEKGVKPTRAIIPTPSAMCAPVTNDTEWYKSDNEAPLFEGLDVLNFPISTNNDLFQKYLIKG